MDISIVQNVHDMTMSLWYVVSRDLVFVVLCYVLVHLRT